MHYAKIKTSLLALALALGGLTACDRDNGLEPQAHDDNAFMQINHTMLAQMDAMMMTGDADHDFAMMMQMHHQGAIDMSNELLKQGDDATIRGIAQKVIDAQQKEKAMLSQFTQAHKAEANTTGQTAKTEYMMSMDKMEKAQDIRILTGDADVDYAQLLIDHHQSALEMAQTELEHGDVQQMKDMAQKMIDDQMKEIDELQTWLRQNKNY